MRYSHTSMCTVIPTHTVIKGNCVHDHELAEVILVWAVVSVPCHDIKW